ncbi:MAG: hypothetical protein PHY47_19070 [Lachnospiraceae bacterium]|nr:hypothetical protein [Lachnospiraceae bacterium]
MDKKRNEKERQELNKKLISNTFKSELKNRKKVNFVKYIIDFIGIFVALRIANFIVEILVIKFWLMEMLITAFLIFVILSFISLFVSMIEKNFYRSR